MDPLAVMRTNLALEIFLEELAAEKSVSCNGRSDSDRELEEPPSFSQEIECKPDEIPFFWL